MWIARRLVVHAAGTGNDKEVGIGGTIGAPSLLVVSENPLHIPSSPPFLAVAPDPFSLPCYMPFESVRWCCWGASLGSLGAGDVASGGGEVVLFAAFFDGVGSR